ncbi:CKLF-like MARVEL transmembrane domain-containing protein 4 [Haliotis rufescens]|uniref:CKLF-like MARVEL transmembrane domain-containing protein 4 n=1 Tax=Haliotis rufescens TaxID=6454 RepID=UPI00201F3F20|nr:CKLF-like MARVEL transmembrane domain-containing protein 4 [Haliotis rufescens]XP_046354381.2 CKLF-like MARVEL transmembrane domain-containing protein 4 [Haliotis rufescens]
MDNEPESASQNTNKEGRETVDLKWGIYIDITYCKSIHGILTAAITIISLIGFICLSAGRANIYCDAVYGSGYSFYGFVSMSDFLTGLINYIIYVLVLYEKIIFKFVPWKIWDLIWSSVWSFFYFIASILVAVQACGQAGNAAAAVFGFMALGLHLAMAYFSFKAWREERSQPGGVTGPQATSSPPEYSAEKNFEQY